MTDDLMVENDPESGYSGNLRMEATEALALPMSNSKRIQRERLSIRQPTKDSVSSVLTPMFYKEQRLGDCNSGSVSRR